MGVTIDGLLAPLALRRRQRCCNTDRLLGKAVENYVGWGCGMRLDDTRRTRDLTDSTPRVKRTTVRHQRVGRSSSLEP